MWPRSRRQLFANVCSYSQEEKTDDCKGEDIYGKYRDQEFRPTSLSGRKQDWKRALVVGTVNSVRDSVCASHHKQEREDAGGKTETKLRWNKTALWL